MILTKGLQSLIPVVMAGIIAVYSLVIAVLIAGSMDPSKSYSLFKCVQETREADEKFMLNMLPVASYISELAFR